MKEKILDSNFEIKSAFGEEVKFYDAESEPFKIYGVIKEDCDDRFCRLPNEVAKATSVRVSELNYNPAGGRVRFTTNSRYIAISAKTPPKSKWTNTLFSNVGAHGFDIYEETEDDVVFLGAFVPPLEDNDGYESIVRLESNATRNIVINFPPYGMVKKLYIGLEPSAEVSEPTPYKNLKPIVYYGSSITQGGCVSKPGDSYEDFISRRFRVDYINLGFAGNAKAEDAIAEYISKLDMSIFVYDYDHNAPNPAFLEATHERMFLKIREANPTLPIVMMTRPRYNVSKDTAARLDIIRKTYNNAKERGDENVYLITGRELMAICKNDGMLEGTHPTSLGFFSMAKALGDVIEKIYEKEVSI